MLSYTTIKLMICKILSWLYCSLPCFKFDCTWNWKVKYTYLQSLALVSCHILLWVCLREPSCRWPCYCKQHSYVNKGAWAMISRERKVENVKKRVTSNRRKILAVTTQLKQLRKESLEKFRSNIWNLNRDSNTTITATPRQTSCRK